MVNIYKPELTVLQQKILRVLYTDAGKSVNARHIAKQLGVSQPAVSKSLPLLEKEEFIQVDKDKESGRLAISLKWDNRRIFWFKRVDNLKQVYESGLAEVLEDSFPGATIILFGSYSRGDDTATSDIDIAVIGRKEKQVDLAKFDQMLGREVIINFYPSFKEIHKHLRENIFNGIVLSGGVEL